MNKIEKVYSYTEFDSETELTDTDRDLLRQATEAARNAYAPYSSFRVGAAIRLSNGQIFIGSNQENSAYPSGLCAERVALFAASANCPGLIVETIAITALDLKAGLKEPVTPCGACRQVMAEYETSGSQSMRIVLGSDNGKIYIIEGMHHLLPLMFTTKYLNK